MSWFSIRPLQSQMVLKISPTASGVVVCWRIRRKASWFSAGVGVFHPEQAIGLEVLAQARGLDRRQAVVHVVQQVGVGAHRRAHRVEQPGRMGQVLVRGPVVLGRQRRVGRLVEQRAATDTVDLLQPGHAALRADRLVAQRLVAQHLVDRLLEVAPVGVAVDQHARAAGAAEQLVQRQPGGLGLQVPQRGVDRRDRAHRHRPAPPVRAAVQVLPDVFDLVRVAADQARDHMVGEVARDGQLAAVERGVAEAREALVGLDLQRHEVAAGATDDDACVGDLHRDNPCTCTGIRSWVKHASLTATGSPACRPRPRD